MKQISKRPDFWLALGIFVPVCVVLQLVFLFSFMHELSFYFTIWGAFFLAQLITILAVTCIALVSTPLRIYLKRWAMASAAILATLGMATIIYAVDTPVLYPSQDTAPITIANLCNDSSVNNETVSSLCFLSLVPPAMSGVVGTFGLNTDPYNIPKTQIVSFITTELLFIFFFLVIVKIERETHDKRRTAL